MTERGFQNFEKLTPGVLIGYLVTIIAGVAGGAWGTATWMGARDTQIFNLEYRVGIIEKAKTDEIRDQRTFQNDVNTKLDRIRATLACVQLLAANKNARCIDNP